MKSFISMRNQAHDVTVWEDESVGEEQKEEEKENQAALVENDNEDSNTETMKMRFISDF